MKPLVIYHADCQDGMGAAFAAWLKLGDEASYVAAKYNDDSIMNLLGGWMIAEREVYILDFSFSREIMDHIFANAKRVVWLDHHKTAFEMWCGKAPKVFFTIHKESDERKHIVLDDCKSGALLAWEYFHPNTEVPMLIKHIDDRDRWQFKLEGSKELHAALASIKPWSFEQWDDIYTSESCPATEAGSFYSLLGEGSAILRAQKQHVDSMAKQARECEIWRPMPNGGWRVGDDIVHFGLAVNATLHMSEVGHELANQSCTYGLVYYVGADNRIKCSLRSNGEYDVSAIARAFGGGGHRNAAGFETDINTLMRWLK